MDYDSVYDYWNSLRPERCVGCECLNIYWTKEGDPYWECELDECYMGEDSYNEEWEGHSNHSVKEVKKWK